MLVAFARRYCALRPYGLGHFTGLDTGLINLEFIILFVFSHASRQHSVPCYVMQIMLVSILDSSTYACLLVYGYLHRVNFAILLDGEILVILEN
jgi:hypothetical protein